jgi:phosphatidylethanolamine-binding protein (PEBP) family uncharacterized protein
MVLVNIAESVTDALHSNEIVPTVIHNKDFKPKGFLQVQYSNDINVTLGNELRPIETASIPRVQFTLMNDDNDIVVKDGDLFSLVMTDPDAPTRGDEKWSEYCHWVIKDIPMDELVKGELTATDLQNRGQIVVPYMGPGPPPNTGLHRYVILLFKQNNNGINVMSSPLKERACWGSGIRGWGAAEWADKVGGETWGVNFFFAKH